MVTKHRPTGMAVSMPRGLLEGTGTSLLLTILLVAVIAKLVDSETLAWEQIGYGIMLTLMITSATGAFITARRIKHRILIVTILFSIIYILSLLMLTALAFGGQYEAVGETMFLVIACSLATGLVEVRRGERKNNQKSRMRRS